MRFPATLFFGLAAMLAGAPDGFTQARTSSATKQEEKEDFHLQAAEHAQHTAMRQFGDETRREDLP